MVSGMELEGIEMEKSIDDQRRTGIAEPSMDAVCLLDCVKSVVWFGLIAKEMNKWKLWKLIYLFPIIFLFSGYVWNLEKN